MNYADFHLREEKDNTVKAKNQKQKQAVKTKN